MTVETHEKRHRRRKMAAMAVRGGSHPREAAAETGLTVRTVRRACEEFKVPWPEPTVRTQPIGSTVLILAGILTGHTVRQISERVGCHRSRVYAVRDQALRCGRLVLGKWPNKFPPPR
jgi:transposase